MPLFEVKLSFKKHRTSNEVGMLVAYSEPIDFDFARKKNMKYLINYVQSTV